ncbi:MAG: hypothetical protein KGH58_00660 [Candidatus Micrarchaeota archaeon]|nr:hypothetical protein [Candidatus Micrarchaeota archaeon]
MDGSFKPITEVQEAESRAAKAVERATREREQAMIEAKAQAAKLVQDAEERAKQKRADTIARAVEQLEKGKRQALEAAVSEARAYKTRRLNKADRARVVRELADLILGA